MLNLMFALCFVVSVHITSLCVFYYRMVQNFPLGGVPLVAAVGLRGNRVYEAGVGFGFGEGGGRERGKPPQRDGFRIGTPAAEPSHRTHSSLAKIRRTWLRPYPSFSVDTNPTDWLIICYVVGC